MDPRPWSGKTLTKLSKHIRDETIPPAGLPSYDGVLIWYDELVDHVITTIDLMPWGNVLGDRYRKPIGRAKTVQTLREKLVRMPTHHLPTIQDLAGVRMEMDMTLDEQDQVAKAICHLFKQDENQAVDDLRAGEHAGYRAVHVKLNLPSLNARVEVQIRTNLQGAWANLYEELADVVGRDIRYEELPDTDWRQATVATLQGASLDGILQVEAARNTLARLEALTHARKIPSGMTAHAMVKMKQALRDVSRDREAIMQQIRASEAEMADSIDVVKTELRRLGDEVRLAAAGSIEENK